MPYAALAGLALIWGASFLLIKIGIRDMSPTVLVFIRSAAGAIALAALMKVMRRPLFPSGLRKMIVPFVFMAVTNALIPWVAIAWGEEHISSGLASILNSTTTLWAAVLVFLLIPHERPGALGYGGVVVGLAGVVILVLPDLLTHGVSGSFLGALAVVVASFSYAVNALYQRMRMRGVSVYEVSLGQLIVTAALALPIAAPSFPQVHLAAASLAAVAALGVFGSGIAYLLYYYMINSIGPVRASGVTLLVPLTAVLWGVVLLGERLSATTVAGMIVVLAGIVLTNMPTGSRRRVVAEPDANAA